MSHNLVILRPDCDVWVEPPESVESVDCTVRQLGTTTQKSTAAKSAINVDSVLLCFRSPPLRHEITGQRVLRGRTIIVTIIVDLDPKMYVRNKKVIHRTIVSTDPIRALLRLQKKG